MKVQQALLSVKKDYESEAKELTKDSPGPGLVKSRLFRFYRCSACWYKVLSSEGSTQSSQSISQTLLN